MSEALAEGMESVAVVVPAKPLASASSMPLRSH